MVAGTNVTINNLVNGTYTWGVQSIDAMGKASTFSTGTFQITNSHFVKAPTNLKVQSYSPYEADVSWTDQSTNETGFVILRTTPLKDGYRAIATVPANTTSYHDSGLMPMNGYSYRIYAIVGADRSALSPVVNYATLNLFEETGPTEFCHSRKFQ
ncbi:MAG: fibronectin type III domain-containing protein [Bacteroidota bacterium]